MIDAEFVERLIRAVDESGIDTVEIKRGGTRVTISKTPPATASRDGSGGANAAVQVVPPPAADASAASPETAQVAPPPASSLMEIESPMVGTFYRAGSPGAPPFVETGQKISEGDTLCIIEAMKLMNEFESEIGGTVEEILVDDGEPVEYGQVLFRVAPL